MEESKFFKWVWRFNGVVIALASALAVILMVYFSYKIYSDITRVRTTGNVVNIEQSTPVQQNWRLGHMSEVKGSTYVVIPLNSEQSYDRSYFSKSASSIRNYLFIDTQSEHKAWLFEHNKFLITSRVTISAGQYASSDKPVLAYLYEVVKSDTNRDGHLTNADLNTVALSKPDGSGYTEVLTDIDALLGNTLTQHNTILIIFQRSGTGYTATIDLDSFAVIHESALPKVGL
ncbi:hypothetical protein [Arsukibacterium sp.]|uniref:hypothetical protein n=1 Tax=Arsukibacterium sp. TaxID=1977258 RepID=UPI002FD89C60